MAAKGVLREDSSRRSVPPPESHPAAARRSPVLRAKKRLEGGSKTAVPPLPQTRRRAKDRFLGLYSSRDRCYNEGDRGAGECAGASHAAELLSWSEHAVHTRGVVSSSLTSAISHA